MQCFVDGEILEGKLRAIKAENKAQELHRLLMGLSGLNKRITLEAWRKYFHTWLHRRNKYG